MNQIYRIDNAGQIKSYEESQQGYLTCFMTVSRQGQRKKKIDVMC